MSGSWKALANLLQDLHLQAGPVAYLSVSTIHSANNSLGRDGGPVCKLAVKAGNLNLYLHL